MGRRTKNHPDRPKLCPICGEIKPPSEFYLSPYGTLRTDCKPCHSAYKKDMWHAKHKEMRKQKTLGKPLENVLT